MAEAAGAQEHEREEEEVIAGMYEDAGGEGAGAESGPREYEADGDEEEEGPEGVTGLIGMHEGERDACGDRGGDHGEDGPLGVAICVEWEGGLACASLDTPVPCGAERGEQEAAEDHFFKERGECDAESEEEPGCAWGPEELVNGCVLRTGEEDTVEQCEDEADKCCGKEAKVETEGGGAVPMKAGEEALIPDEREDGEAEGKGGEIHDGHAAEGVVDVSHGLGGGGDPIEMKVESEEGEEAGAEPPDEDQDAQQGEVAEVGGASGWLG